MTLIAPHFLDSTVAIGDFSDNEEIRWTGAGFLFGLHTKDNENGQKGYQIYLVTNKHVSKIQTM